MELDIPIIDFYCIYSNVPVRRRRLEEEVHLGYIIF